MSKSVYTSTYRRMLSCLVQARRSAGLNQTELAKRLGRPQSFVSKFEAGERRIDVVELIAICNKLDLDPAEVIAVINQGWVISQI